MVLALIIILGSYSIGPDDHTASGNQPPSKVPSNLTTFAGGRGGAHRQWQDHSAPGAVQGVFSLLRPHHHCGHRYCKRAPGKGVCVCHLCEVHTHTCCGHGVTPMVPTCVCVCVCACVCVRVCTFTVCVCVCTFTVSVRE